MEFKDYKKELLEQMREAVRLFSNQGKTERELWITQKFLNVIGVPYAESELYRPNDEPPDVTFRDARFEIIKLYDEDRRRHDEYRNKLKKIEAARDYSEILDVEHWDIESISLSELIKIAEDHLQIKKGNYSPAIQDNLDVLIYVNMQKITIDDKDYVLTTPLLTTSFFLKWRSVSFIFNRDIVYVANASFLAPKFIQTVASKVVSKK